MKLSKLPGVVKKVWKRVSRIDEYYRAKMLYPRIMKEAKLDPRLILLESQHGTSCDGNIFYLLRELSTERYSEYRCCLSVRASKVKRTREFLEAHGLGGVEILTLSSERYFRVLASAKYLINDNTFLPFFVKQAGQVYLNTWHGTPLKTLGKCSQVAAGTIGNTQRNFCQADYILAPNMHTLEVLRDEYMLENLSSSSFVLGGYPRNEVFFDESAAAIVREKEGLGSSYVVAYMPTWRNYGGFADKCAEAHLLHHLCDLDRSLSGNQLMYVNLHPVARNSIDFSAFKRIRPFPDCYETYEFLNACDCLVTDYSSVLFDYLLTRKKIILFAFDLAEYEESRGFLFSPEELGLPVVDSVSSLVSEIEKPVDEETIRELSLRYAPYDSSFASKVLCGFFLLGNGSDRLSVIPISDNSKENVLVYVGNLARNGITSSFRSLLNVSGGFSDCNVFFTSRQQTLSRPSLPVLREFSEKIPYVLMAGKMNLSFLEKAVHYLYKQRMLPFAFYRRFMASAYEREWDRLFGCMRFDKVIHFTGYEYRIQLLFDSFKGEKSIFVHNNMVEEMKRRQNQRKAVLRYIYRSYTKVALVSEDMREPTLALSESDANFVIVPNSFDFNHVVNAAEKELLFDQHTRCNVSFEKLNSILESSDAKLITIGRFSPEKAHVRLVEAFGKYLSESPGAYLIIVGGSSYSLKETSFEGLSEWVSTLDYSDRVVLVLSMSNPYSILARCDGFILSSRHEGLGLVLLEADALGLPVVATDIPGPRGFMQKNGGFLVPDTDQGVYQGVSSLMKGEVRPMGVDYVSYNRDALEAFRKLL